MLDAGCLGVRSGWSADPTEAASLEIISPRRVAYAFPSRWASWARRSLLAATIFMVLVIFRVFFKLLSLTSNSLILGMLGDGALAGF